MADRRYRETRTSGERYTDRKIGKGKLSIDRYTLRYEN
jgi:hypothetical protein